MTLAPHSSLTYSGDDCRNVEMQGKIYFEVRHDEEHPFDVRGGAAHVRVLGTQFEVDDRASSASQSAPSASVFVTGGRVLFAALHRDSEGVILGKGMKAVLPRGAALPVLSEDADINEVAWATHKIHFSDAPMNEVLRVLGEYYGMRLTASDMSKRLTGDFDARNRQQVIQVIEETLGIEIKEK
ncbi:MAG: FecR domain-containing protein [Prevotella sp.]|nr:FecR domain-containing protein [Prevotella sp.]